MQFCTECGAKLEKDGKFCSSCGFKVAIEKELPIKNNIDSKPTKSESSESSIYGKVSSKVRVSPIYGAGYKEGIDCSNCGSRFGQGRVCAVCGTER